MKLLTLLVFLCVIILTNCQDLQSQEELDENEQSRMKRSHDLGRQITPRTKPINNNNLPVKTFNNKQQIPSKFKTTQKPMNLLLKSDHPSSTHIAVDLKAKNKETAPSIRNDVPAYLLYGYKQPKRRQPILNGALNIPQVKKLHEETHQKEEPNTTKKDFATDLSDKAPELQVAPIKLKENVHVEKVVPKDCVDLYENRQKSNKQYQPTVYIAPLSENIDVIPTDQQPKHAKVLKISDIFFEEEESNNDLRETIKSLDKNGTTTSNICNEESKNDSAFAESHNIMQQKTQNNTKPDDNVNIIAHINNKTNFETISKTKNPPNQNKELDIKKIESKSNETKPHDINNKSSPVCNHTTVSVAVNPASEGLKTVKLEINHIIQEDVTKNPDDKTNKNLKMEQIQIDKIKIEPNETIIIENRKVEEVIETYKPPPYSTPNNGDVQTTWYSPQVWDYGPTNQAIPYTFNSAPNNGFYSYSAYNPYFDAPREFDYPFVNQMTDTSNNYRDHAHKRHYANPCYTQKIKPEINNKNYNIGSLEHSFNQCVNHNKFKDRIWRTWRDTHIIVTKNQNTKGKPIEIEL